VWVRWRESESPILPYFPQIEMKNVYAREWMAWLSGLIWDMVVRKRKREKRECEWDREDVSEMEREWDGERVRWRLRENPDDYWGKFWCVLFLNLTSVTRDQSNKCCLWFTSIYMYNFLDFPYFPAHTFLLDTCAMMLLHELYAFWVGGKFNGCSISLCWGGKLIRKSSMRCGFEKSDDRRGEWNWGDRERERWREKKIEPAWEIKS
jgi:hypothetical protein